MCPIQRIQAQRFPFWADLLGAQYFSQILTRRQILVEDESRREISSTVHHLPLFSEKRGGVKSHIHIYI